MRYFTLCFVVFCFYSNGFSQEYRDFLREDWSESTGEWINSVKVDYTLENGQPMLMSIQSFNTQTQEWYNNEQTVYEYHPEDSYNIRTRQKWIDGEWTMFARGVDSLNGSGRTTDYTYFIYQDNDWSLYTRETSIYLSDTILVEEYHQGSSDDTFSQKTEFLYTESGRLDSIKSFRLNSGEWIHRGVNEYLYTPFDKRLHLYVWSRYAVGDEWELQHEINYAYDSNQFLIQEDYIFYGFQNNIIDQYRYDYTNNADGVITQYVHREFTNGEWVNFLRYTYNLEDVNTVSDIESLQFVVYPNPAQTDIQFSTANFSGGDSFQIINSVGKTVAKGTLAGSDNHIDVRTLPSGFYLLKIQTGSKTGISKFVKR